MIWLTTDTHLGHDKMIELAGRPQDHSERILQGLRKNPKEGDVLIHLGDICIGNDEAWHFDIEGYVPKGVKKILIKGNHDHKSNQWYLNHGWDFVCSAFIDRYFGKTIVFSHKPFEVKVGDMNIHGHFHNNDHRSDESASYYNPDYHKKLAVEETNYLPVNLEKWIRVVDKSVVEKK